MQRFVERAAARIANVVGGRDGPKLADEILADCKQRLDELEQQVTSVRSQFATYAEQMMQSCEASVLLSKSVADFYRAANNSARSDSVKKYEQVQDAAANNAVAIYQRQLQMEDGVVSELDQWLQIIARVNEQIEEADRLRQAAETAAARLQTLQNKVDSRRQGGSIFSQNNDTDISNRIEETERAQKNFEADFMSAREEVRDNVTRIMQKRFTMFDRVYVQILECQVQFFESASKDVEGFKRSIRNYRRKFPRDSGSNMSSTLSNGGMSRSQSAQGTGESTDEPKPTPLQSQQSEPLKSTETPARPMPARPASQSTTNELQHEDGLAFGHRKKETDFLGDMLNFEPNDVAADALEDSSGDLGDFGAFVSAPAQDSAKPRTVRQESDLFGLNYFAAASGAHGHSDTEVEAANRPHQQHARKGSKSTMDLGTISSPGNQQGGAMFDNFWDDDPAPTSRPGSRVNSGYGLDPVDSIDPVTEFMGAPSSPTMPESKSTEEPPHLLPDAVPMGGPGFGSSVLNTSDASKRREFVRQLQQQERENHENREQAQDAVESLIRDWEFKDGVRRNVRALLSTMDKVLWDGAKWKPVQMSTLINPKKIQKTYKKALNSVHPDKISLTRGNTPEQIAIAEGIFMALNEAWIEYEKQSSS